MKGQRFCHTYIRLQVHILCYVCVEYHFVHNELLARVFLLWFLVRFPYFLLAHHEGKSFLLDLQIHLYGTSLGGFLAQLFAQHRPRRVKSLVLSNTFLETSNFSAAMPWAPMYVINDALILFARQARSNIIFVCFMLHYFNLIFQFLKCFYLNSELGL